MTGTGGEALEFALNLMRVPALRGVLRARPLPGGVGEVLAIASGSSEATRVAARRTGHGEDELTEAARFYVQQVLLFEEADAYRILGTHRGADRATLRDHHHLLLRWLHPDRSDADAQWDSALSTRVNQAWNQLRSSEARARYDATLDALDGAAIAPESAAMPAQILRHAPMPHAEAPSTSRAAPIAVAALGLACVALAWLALQREDRRDARQADPPPPTQAARTTAPPPEAALPAPVATLLALPATEMELAALAPAPPDPPVADAIAADLPAPGWPEPVVAETDSAPAVVPMPPASTSPLASAATIVAVPRPPPPAPIHIAATAAPPSIPPPPEPAPPAPPVHPAQMPAAPSASVVATSALAPIPEPAVDEDPLLLLRQAEATLLAVTRYLAAADASAPAWRDGATGHAAADIRRRLLARNEGSGSTRLALQSPNWTLGSRDASVLGPYRLDDHRGLREAGFLHVELARHDRQWQVASLRLEPSP